MCRMHPSVACRLVVEGVDENGPTSWNQVDLSNLKPTCCNPSDQGLGDQEVAPLVSFPTTVTWFLQKECAKWNVQGYYFHYFPFS